MSPPTEKRNWDAHLYDSRHSFVWKHGASLVELLAPQAGESILDLGCGTGHLTAQIAATGARVHGIDHSTEMIAEAQRHYPDLPFSLQDARTLPENASFDAVFSNAVLHWIPEAEAVVRGVERSLKSGGRFVAEFGGRGNVREILRALRHAFSTLGIPLPSSPWYFPGIAEYSDLLERCGLEVTFATLFDRPTPLEDAEGLRHWVRMFGGSFLAQVPESQREPFFGHLEEAARPTLLGEAGWFADYRRLRVVAWRRKSDFGDLHA